MCARFTSTRQKEDFVHYFGLLNAPDFSPRFNVAPNQTVPVVRTTAGGRECVPMTWGLVPAWAKPDTPQAAAGLVNAKAETVLEKPAFRDAAKFRRCLVPADGFIEWESAAGKKHPHWFRLADGGTFAFAGLWEPASPGAKKAGETFAILTVPASPDVSHLHDRMPVILLPDQFEPWLATDSRTWMELLKPLPAGSLLSHPVNPALNSPRFDHAGLLTPSRVGLFD